MSSILLSSILPRPVRDFFTIPYQIYQNCQDSKQQPEDPSIAAAVAAKPFILGKDNLSLVRELVKTIVRIAMLALAAYAYSQVGISIKIAAVLTNILSVPAFGMAGGTWLTYYGVTKIVSALSTGFFSSLAFGLGSVVLGYVLLEGHDKNPVGLLEHYFIKPLTSCITF